MVCTERGIMLTLKDLQEIPPQTVIATGVTIDNPSGINMSNSDKILRWVAVRGGMPDWAIYIYFDYQSVDWVRLFGDKVTSKENIKRLVPCNDEAFKQYRY